MPGVQNSLPGLCRTSLLNPGITLYRKCRQCETVSDCGGLCIFIFCIFPGTDAVQPNQEKKAVHVHNYLCDSFCGSWKWNIPGNLSIIFRALEFIRCFVNRVKSLRFKDQNRQSVPRSAVETWCMIQVNAVTTGGYSIVGLLHTIEYHRYQNFYLQF